MDLGRGAGSKTGDEDFDVSGVESEVEFLAPVPVFVFSIHSGQFFTTFMTVLLI